MTAGVGGVKEQKALSPHALRDCYVIKLLWETILNYMESRDLYFLYCVPWFSLLCDFFNVPGLKYWRKYLMFWLCFNDQPGA